MPYYRVQNSQNKAAVTWSSFKDGVLSRQVGSLAVGTEFYGLVAGKQDDTNHTVILVGMLYTKAIWLTQIPEPEPVEEPPEEELPPTTPPTPEPTPEGLWVVRGDEELAEFGYRSRTADPNWAYLRQTPSVFRFDKFPVQKPTEYRVDITPMDAALRQLNGYDDDVNRIVYLYSAGTALFNRTGFPKLQYLTMSFNILQGIGIENNCLKFKTLVPNSNTSGLTRESHPWFVHKWDIVTMRTVEDVRYTTHVNTPHGNVFWYLTSIAGYGYIPLRWVRPLSPSIP